MWCTIRIVASAGVWETSRGKDDLNPPPPIPRSAATSSRFLMVHGEADLEKALAIHIFLRTHIPLSERFV